VAVRVSHRARWVGWERVWVTGFKDPEGVHHSVVAAVSTAVAETESPPMSWIPRSCCEDHEPQC